MGIPAFQNSFGSSVLFAWNSAMNGRLSMMPSPLNPETGLVMNSNSQIYSVIGNGMQNRMLFRKENNIFKEIYF